MQRRQLTPKEKKQADWIVAAAHRLVGALPGEQWNHKEGRSSTEEEKFNSQRERTTRLIERIKQNGIMTAGDFLASVNTRSSTGSPNGDPFAIEAARCLVQCEMASGLNPVTFWKKMMGGAEKIHTQQSMTYEQAQQAAQDVVTILRDSSLMERFQGAQNRNESQTSNQESKTQQTA